MDKQEDVCGDGVRECGALANRFLHPIATAALKCSSEIQYLNGDRVDAEWTTSKYGQYLSPDAGAQTYLTSARAQLPIGCDPGDQKSVV